MKSDPAKQNSALPTESDTQYSAPHQTLPRSPTTNPSEFYDDLDEFGNDKMLPPSLSKPFQYEPNILSEKLVELQEFIYEKKPTVQYYLDRSIDTIFYTERKILGAANWLTQDAPALAWPTTQVAAMSLLGYTANRHQSLVKKLGSPLALAVMTGFLVYPSWRKTASQLTNHHLITPIPALEKAGAAARRFYWGSVVANGVKAWDAYDDGCHQARSATRQAYQRIVEFFKPSRRS